MQENNKKLTGSKNITHNVLWNLVGAGLPLLAAVFVIPILINSMGTARFGVLTLAWAVVGYFSLLDMGLGRALTKLASEMLGLERANEIPGLAWTALGFLAIMGILGMVIFAGISPWLVERVLKIPAELILETLTAFYLLAASIPIVIISMGLRGILEAYRYFNFVNLVRIPLGILTFLGPLAVLPFSNSLVPIVGVLVAARLIACYVYMRLCLFIEPELRKPFGIQRDLIRPLLNFGGWITVSNIISPMMVYMDRFLIGTMISITAVAYYATPYMVVTKLSIIPGALISVLFPVFSSEFVSDKARVVLLYKRAVGYIFSGMFPLVLILTTFAKEGLNIWLGEDFAANSYLVFLILAVGVFINSLAYVASGLIQGTGHPELTAKLHLIELPLYLLIFWWLVTNHGIVGAAIAWAARVSIDMVVLFIMAERILPMRVFPYLIPLLIGVLVIMAVGVAIPNFISKGLFILVVMLLFTLVFWYLFLGSDERTRMKRLFRKRSFSD